MLENIKQNLIEIMADYLDSESLKLNEAIALVKDPRPREESELHIRMAEAAFIEYKKTVIDVNGIKKTKANYSKKKFEGFTHRFIVRFRVDEDYRNDTMINIYSDSDSYSDLEDFINEKESDKVVMSFKFEHRASKEQDEIADSFIDEFLKT
jgi:hypothetical protein